MIEQTEQISLNTLTDGIKDLMTRSARDGDYLELPFDKANEPAVVDRDTRSVYEIAVDAGMTVFEYAARFPETAIRQAEACLAQWLSIETAAAIEGAITLADGNKYAITRNQTQLISKRVEDAKSELKQIRWWASISPHEGEQARDVFNRAMLNMAVYEGNVKMLSYVADRHDGRPTEQRFDDVNRDYAFACYQILHMMFDKQLRVLNSGPGTKLICCSRRAGKTMLLIGTMLIECLRTPRLKCLYIGETMELSEKLVDTAAQEIIDYCKLRDMKGKRLDWKHLDNGSEIVIRGLSNTKDPDQIRGQKAKIIVIDEFFHLKSELLEYLQREVLEPMQMDYADDYKFICAGTPPSIKGTFGEMAWKNWDCDKFFWTWRDNPHPVSVVQRKEYIDKILSEKGLGWDSSYARREYNGEWAYDEDLLLYPTFQTYNPREAIPSIKVSRVLFGIDYGVSDNDTLIGIAWSDEERRGYIFREDKFNRLDIKDRTISQLQYLKEQVRSAWREALDFFPGLEPREANKRILWDADSNDQHLTDDMNINVRLEDAPEIKLNIDNAHKTDKVMMFDKIRDLLRTGAILLPSNGKTAHECLSTVLKRGPSGEVYPEVDDSAFHPDLLPAMRYALYNAIGS